LLPYDSLIELEIQPEGLERLLREGRIGNMRVQELEEMSDNQPQMISQDTASEFVRKLSHDVTGMVHNIIGYATLLEEEPNPEYIKGIAKQATRIRERVQQAVADVDNGSLACDSST
jgi:signal transduction histidine kinase